jgi:type VI secretion system protein ImpK
MPVRNDSSLRTVPDLCEEAFGFCLTLRRGEFPSDPEELHRRIGALFKKLDLDCKEQRVNGENVRLAQYAIAAFLDEIILSSDWSRREEWSARPLQLEYFNDDMAGENFYAKLDALRGTKESEELDVLQVYATCLALGFKGKLSDPRSREKPRLLVVEIVRELKAARKQAGDELSVHWLPEEVQALAVRRTPVWVVAGVCAAVVLGLFLLFEFRLRAEMKDVTGLATGQVVEEAR